MEAERAEKAREADTQEELSEARSFYVEIESAEEIKY